MSVGYSDFIQQLQDAGFKTTRINSAKGEADFSDYGNALSADLQSMITDSFDCEADYDLQAQIASLYGNKSNLHRSDFVAGCKALGLTVEVSYVKSSYIPDNKADGRYDTDISTASIGMYKISDGKGGEIIIADANGNGALEIEELFMNQILNDVAVDLDKINSNKIAGASALAHGSSSSSNVSSSSSSGRNSAEEKVDENEFNKIVERYLSNGFSMSAAERMARSSLGDNTMSYTGTMEEQSEEKEKEEKVTQSDFDKLVEQYLNNGRYSSVDAAEKKASKYLDVSGFDFSGEDPFKKLEEEKELAA